MDKLIIRENFEEQYSLCLIDSENKFSNISDVISLTKKDDVMEYCLYLYFTELDKFEKFLDDFEFVVIFSKSIVSKHKDVFLYKVCDINYSRKNYSRILNKIQVNFSFRIVKEFEISNEVMNEDGFYSIVKQIRRELKLNDLGI